MKKIKWGNFRHSFISNFIGIISFFVSAIIAAVLIYNFEQSRQQAEREKVANLANNYAHLLEQNIQHSISVTYALAGLVHQGKGAVSDFNNLAKEMLLFYPGATLELAPDGIIQNIMPLKGNEGAIGMDLLNGVTRSEEAVLAKESRKLIFVGPFNLKQGGIGAVARLPVYLNNVKGKYFWGFTIALIRFPEVLNTCRLKELTNRGFQYKLWCIDSKTSAKLVIASSSTVALLNPVDEKLQLPNGVWVFSIEPTKGWTNPLEISINIILGLIFSLMFGIITKLLVESKAQERDLGIQVFLRTEELEAEIAERKQAELQLLEKTAEIEYQNKELKNLNVELVFAKEKAEESDRLKMAFLANISHEIRSPLNGILGFSQLLSSPDTTREEHNEYVDIIRSCGVQLMTIIDDIIDIARIEANQMKIEKKAVNINDLLSGVELLYKEKMAKSEVILSCTKALEDDKSVIFSDPARLSQILINLIGNAIKFTRAGHIQFGYQSKENRIVFFVEDTGIGIDKEKQSFIFNRFAQVETEFSKMAGGTGLGLSISKALVELLGGEIWVDSILGQGSTFYFSIPYIPITPKIIVEENKTKNVIIGENFKAKKTILIAEDEFYNYLYLSKLLNSQQFEILHAKNGIEAVGFVRENPTINLVLMDLKMPLMDGIKATAEIKKLNKSLPIIAQTAYAQEGDRELAILAGCDDYIAKPYKNEALLDMVMKYIGE